MMNYVIALCISSIIHYLLNIKLKRCIHKFFVPSEFTFSSFQFR